MEVDRSMEKIEKDFPQEDLTAEENEVIKDFQKEEDVQEGKAEILEDEEFEEIEEEDSSNLLNIKRELKNVKDENQKLTNEIEALKDRLLRTSAEYDNYRKRTQKEKEGIYSDACEDVLKNLLPVLDNLERAAQVEGSSEDIKKGVEMTVRQFYDALSKLGIEEIETKDGFDPNYHNAVMHVQDKCFGSNEVVEVFQKGFKKDNRVIRFSMVKVAN